MKSFAYSTIVAIALLLLGTGTAAAQQYYSGQPAPASPFGNRQGFLIGLGLNAGSMSCQGSTFCEELNASFESAAGLEIHLGTMLSPRLGLVFDIWGMGHTSEEEFGDVTMTQTLLTGGVQYWLLPRLWIKGGLGLAQFAWNYEGPLDVEVGDESELVPAFLAGIGYELAVGRSFALDVQFRYGTGYYKDDEEDVNVTGHNAAFGVGLTWF